MKFISIDIGTTGGKVALFSQDIQLLSCFRKDYPTYYTPNGHQAKQDPNDWWEMAVEGIHKVIDETGTDKSEIAGIGLSCMTPVLLPVDKNGKPLSKAWLWYDRRAAGMAEKVRQKMNDSEFEKITGSVCKDISFLPKLLHFRETEPSCYENTYMFLQANGYLVYQLTGSLCMDRSHGELLLLSDKETGEYSREICNAFAIDEEKLPPIVDSDRAAGRLSAAAAQKTGLPQGIVVVSGGHDSALSAYALGILKQGDACLDIGNAANLVMCTETAISCKAADSYRHPVRGKWLFQIFSATIGAAFRWYKDLFGAAETIIAEKEGVSVYDILCREAAKSPPGANGVIFMPYLQGAQQNIHSSGAFLNLKLGHCRQDMIRALLEGCAMSIRLNMEQMEEASGIGMKEITVCGGGSRNLVWLQIFADVLNRSLVVLPISDAAVTGAAMLVKKEVETDIFFHEGENVKSKRVLPDSRRAEVYNQVYSQFYQAFTKNN